MHESTTSKRDDRVRGWVNVREVAERARDTTATERGGWAGTEPKESENLAQMAAAKEQRRTREQEGKVKVRRSRCRVREKRGAEAG